MPGSRRADFQEPPDRLRLLAGPDRIALGGALDDITTHHHASPVIIVGLDRPLRLVAGRTHTSRAALIAPGFSHAVDVAGGRIAVFVLPPHAMSRAAMAPVADLAHPGAWLELGGALVRGALTDFAPVDRAIACDRGARPIDDRLRRVLDALRDRLDENLPIEVIAADVGLSPSRLMSLAHAQIGSSLRSVRRWLRTFAVVRDYAAGASLTTAALDAGFASSSHLSAAAREHFGIRPSQILSPRTRTAITFVPAP